jgi:hypothetical protein
MKTELSIRECSVSQTMLEQIFNQFAAQQSEEQGVTRGMYKGAKPSRFAWCFGTIWMCM